MNFKHGATTGGKATREYLCWSRIKTRCTNPRNIRYDRYGGRGIRMCEEWSDSFEAFLRDMGPRPPGHSIDRINNDGNYEPGNCRWAPDEVQRNNRSTNRYIVLGGERLTISQAIKRLGLSKVLVFNRIHNGRPVEVALGLNADSLISDEPT